MTLTRTVVLLSLVAWSLGASKAAASETSKPPLALAPALVTFLSPQAGATLRGGEAVEVRWSGVPAEAEEVELLLSLDGGRGYSLRLTEELDADSRSFLWRVPNVVADRAALGIRMGIGGREITATPGPIFQIAPDASLPSAPLRWASGEIWVDADHDGGGNDVADDRPQLPDVAFSADPPRIIAAEGESRDLILPRSFDVCPTARDWKFDRCALRATDESPIFDFRRRSPLSIPQRI